MPMGLYISVPFCRSKCSYCNFASDVFSAAVHERYIDCVCQSIERSHQTAGELGAVMDRAVDSIFLGGGTPTVLDMRQLERLFVAVRSTFCLQSDAEITVECAPGAVTPAVLEVFQRCGINRVSLGVQSFVDAEAAAVGRVHKLSTVMSDITRLRAGGISNINVDLIAGLPHQTMESWNFSVQKCIACEVPHVSVYMLEVDEDSRLGREVMAGGTRYHAHFVPDEDLVADFYESACEKLNGAGIGQYEISNFARQGSESRHNLKYWTRKPYIGFGLDAHCMLFAQDNERNVLSPGEDDRKRARLQPCRQSAQMKCGTTESRALIRDRTEEVSSEKSCHLLEDPASIRFSTADSLDEYLAVRTPAVTSISPQTALEETFFLGLRLNAGIDLEVLGQQFGIPAIAELSQIIEDCVRDGLIERSDHVIRLTPRGRLLSNEVFQRFIAVAESAPIRGA